MSDFIKAGKWREFYDAQNRMLDKHAKFNYMMCTWLSREELFEGSHEIKCSLSNRNRHGDIGAGRTGHFSCAVTTVGRGGQTAGQRHRR